RSSRPKNSSPSRHRAAMYDSATRPAMTRSFFPNQSGSYFRRVSKYGCVTSITRPSASWRSRPPAAVAWLGPAARSGSRRAWLAPAPVTSPVTRSQGRSVAGGRRSARMSRTTRRSAVLGHRGPQALFWLTMSRQAHRPAEAKRPLHPADKAGVRRPRHVVLVADEVQPGVEIEVNAPQQFGPAGETEAQRPLDHAPEYRRTV